MMGRNAVETVMGAVVLCIAVLFVYFAYTTAQLRSAPGYNLEAVFGRLGGLATGSDVRISGVKVGTVTQRELDTKTYDARIAMRIDDSVKLPEDTVASIVGDGLLGGRYVRLEPGTSTVMLAPGEVIRNTRGYRSLEDQVGDIIFLATSKPGDGPSP